MAYFHCLIGGGSSGGGYELTVTCDADFAGTTITATDGVTTLTQTCPSASPYEVVFEIPNGGDWTISGTISGDVYSTSINIPSSLELHYISAPEGSTVLPTDDIQTWLACANITDKSYTTLAEVLADRETFEILISDSNACDYMARSTTWASDTTDDADTMALIGKYDYCSNALLGNSTWREAICNSNYFESVLNVKVPTMTSDTTPEGQVVKNGQYQTSEASWKAFDGDSNTHWSSGTSGSVKYLGYIFTSPVCVNCMHFEIDSADRIPNFTIQAYDGNTWDDITNAIVNTQVSRTYDFANNTDYSGYRISVTTNGAVVIKTLQFYGRASSNVSNTNGIIHTAMGNESVYCVETGDTFTATDGIATVDFSQFDEGVYTFGSTTAKNPTDLSQDYTKQFKITKSPYGGTTELYLMPDAVKTLYWWGYMSDNVESVIASNGWSWTNFSILAPTYNTNDVYWGNQTGEKGGGIGTKNKVSNINKCHVVWSGSPSGNSWINMTNSKNTNDEVSGTHNVLILNTANTQVYQYYAYDNIDAYIEWLTLRTAWGRLNALWYE